MREHPWGVWGFQCPTAPGSPLPREPPSLQLTQRSGSRNNSSAIMEIITNNNKAFCLLPSALFQGSGVFPSTLLLCTWSTPGSILLFGTVKTLGFACSCLVVFYCMFPFSKDSPHNCCMWNAENMVFISPYEC